MLVITGFELGKRKNKSNLVRCMKYPVLIDSKRSNGHKLNHRKLHLNMKNFFMLRGAKPWNRLCRGVLESPSLETFKTHHRHV